MSVSFEGIGENLVTFTASSVTAGRPVKMSASGTVTDCANSNRFMGIARSVSGGCAAVITEGYVKMAYTGTAPAVGYGRLVATGSASVKADSGTTGGEYLIIDVDTAASTVGFIL